MFARRLERVASIPTGKLPAVLVWVVPPTASRTQLVFRKGKSSSCHRYHGVSSAYRITSLGRAFHFHARNCLFRASTSPNTSNRCRNRSNEVSAFFFRCSDEAIGR